MIAASDHIAEFLWEVLTETLCPSRVAAVSEATDVSSRGRKGSS